MFKNRTSVNLIQLGIGVAAPMVDSKDALTQQHRMIDSIHLSQIEISGCNTIAQLAPSTPPAFMYKLISLQLAMF